MSNKFTITFLGTSSALPQVERRQSSVAIQYRNHSLLVDVGEATQVQLLKHKIGFSNLTVLLTHLHSDHTLGLIGLLTTRSFYNISKSITIIGPPRTSSFIFLQLLAYRLYPEYDIKVIETNGGMVLSNSDFYIESFPVSHGDNCLGYKIITHKSLGVFNVDRALEKNIPKGKKWKSLQEGYPIELDNKTILPSEVLDISTENQTKIVITGDTPLDDNVINNSANADLLIHDSTYPIMEKQRAKKHKHSTCTEAAYVAKRANVKKLILTHFSELHKDLSESLRDAKEIFSNSILAYDGLVIEV
ncbi:MAG: ribonuclease Z [Candidatus Heimdallarchaeaceae archaeon]